MTLIDSFAIPVINHDILDWREWHKVCVKPIPNVESLSHLDGDIEHTLKKHAKMTHSCEKIGIGYAATKILHCGRKKEAVVEGAIE